MGNSKVDFTKQVATDVLTVLSKANLSPQQRLAVLEQLAVVDISQARLRLPCKACAECMETVRVLLEMLAHANVALRELAQRCADATMTMARSEPEILGACCYKLAGGDHCASNLTEDQCRTLAQMQPFVFNPGRTCAQAMKPEG